MLHILTRISPLLHCPLLHCPPLPHGAALSTPAFSTPATSCRIVHSCNVHSRKFSVPWQTYACMRMRLLRGTSVIGKSQTTIGISRPESQLSITCTSPLFYHHVGLSIRKWASVAVKVQEVILICKHCYVLAPALSCPRIHYKTATAQTERTLKWWAKSVILRPT